MYYTRFYPNILDCMCVAPVYFERLVKINNKHDGNVGILNEQDYP